MSLRISLTLLLLTLLSCEASISPEKEVYAYIIEKLPISEEENGVFILQNPGSVCGHCINAGNELSLKYNGVPTITTLSRKRLIRGENCIIDTSGGVFDLLPSTMISYVLVKEGEELSFITLDQKNKPLIASRIEELGLQ